MGLNHLCFILPADGDEDRPIAASNKKTHKKPKFFSSSRKGQPTRGARIVVAFQKSLRRCFVPANDPATAGFFHDTDGVQISGKPVNPNPTTFSYSELYIGTRGFSDDEILGSGGFGRVYRAVLPSDGKVVAVKCLAGTGEKFEKTFMAELTAVAHLRHRNLVPLRGWCVHDDQVLLVYDYMPNLSLDRVLFKKPEQNAKSGFGVLDWERRRKIGSGLASALFYLHEQLETQIIHRDVKTSNIMLDSSYNARLGDFGLARWLEHDLFGYQVMFNTPTRSPKFRLSDTTKIGGTIGYLPPESFQRLGGATAKSDIFSFGIVLLEIASGRRAVDLTFPDDEIVLLDWMRRLSDQGMVLEAGDPKLKDGSYRLSEMEHLIHVGLLCTINEPKLRPDMKWVSEALYGNVCGKLPSLPSFKFHPPYISISSSSDNSSSNGNPTTTTKSTTATTITITYDSLLYTTAREETIYETAGIDSRSGNNSSNISSTHSLQRPNILQLVETPREISYKEIVSATKNFSNSQRVAELDFGTAYHGVLNNGQHVLVKRVGMKTCPALRLRFTTELLNLGRLRHRNLFRLMGWCTEHGEMLVIYNYAVNHRLLRNLILHQNPNDKILQWNERYMIVKSLASAIRYLHEEWDEQVVHRCITSSAICINPKRNPRLGSFALAEFLARNEHEHHVEPSKSTSVRGIFGYMAPEYMESGEATPAADIYSFGVVMLEIVSGFTAVDHRLPEVLLVKRVHGFEVRKRKPEELADCRLNGEYDQTELVRLVKLGAACTRSNPNFRPNIKKIVRILDGHDSCFLEEELRKEGSEEWKARNAASLALIRRIQALGLQ